MESLELRHLRYFVAVADAKHMTRAAEGLGIQQPPLSQQIRALEDHLGVKLFVRHPRGVALTDAGGLFLAEARRLLQDVAAAEQRMARLARGEEGLLNVGFTSSAAAHVFTPAALRACRREHPGIALALSECNAAEITESVAASRLHCGLLRVPVARPAGLAFQTLLREPVVVALPIDHPLAGRPGTRRPLSLRDLAGEKLILVRRPGAPGLYGNLLALFEEKGLRPQVAAEVERMMTNLNLVAAGVGVSVVPASMQGQHPHAIVYRALAESARLDAPLTLVYREADCAGPTASFLALMRRIAAEWTGDLRP
ncbi:LysR family transcriptional regulator [Variovorax terrae]|uniref:LysR family transcriptional regulator n=1 Tax=Variovorax terrae TaxID=2923278 RepID=A0A9X2AMD2_9BURK|nr:LysR family transcriptional regulator [Variovorax terrae]MCJ0762605.1 LysR family transcriptional regulator [Variovorax terrae]